MDFEITSTTALGSNGTSLSTSAPVTQSATNPWSVTTGTVNSPNILSNPLTFTSTAFGIELDANDTTSVPEPGTMILTGSALAAGAISTYFKRRRKDKKSAESETETNQAV